MSDETDQQAHVRRWLDAFAAALARDADAVADLFTEAGSWRDILAFSSDFRTLTGPDRIRGFATHLTGSGLDDIQVAGPVPSISERLGLRTADWAFTFSTRSPAVGPARCRGVLRLVDRDGQSPRAFSLLTVIDELIGHEEAIGHRRPRGDSGAHTFGAPNWLDKRREATRYDGAEPDVLIVGGGQGGLSTAARLRQLGVRALIVDRMRRVGDNWRNRYHSLTLHNEVWSNHLPYMPFPPSWPVYIPKDMIANWFEAYVDALELDFWTDTEFVGATFDPTEDRWAATVRRGDAERVLRPRHIVMATGVSGIPYIPSIPSLADFTGTVIHSSAYTSGQEYAGRHALVIGTGNSGHDVAQDLHSHGATVTLVQRSPTTVLSLEPSAQKYYSIYSEDTPTEVSDLLFLSIAQPIMVELFRKVTSEVVALDRELLDGLATVGFRTDIGDDHTGFQMKYFRRGGGYYINVGCSDLLIAGEIGLRQFADLERFTRAGAVFRPGDELPVDLVVFATGYKPIQEAVRRHFGDSVAELVGPVWGFDEEGEMRAMARPTGQRNLWFIGGGLFQCRIYSKLIALQIKASEVYDRESRRPHAGQGA